MPSQRDPQKALSTCLSPRIRHFDAEGSEYLAGRDFGSRCLRLRDVSCRFSWLAACSVTGSQNISRHRWKSCEVSLRSYLKANSVCESKIVCCAGEMKSVIWAATLM